MFADTASPHKTRETIVFKSGTVWKATIHTSPCLSMMNENYKSVTEHSHTILMGGGGLTHIVPLELNFPQL